MRWHRASCSSTASDGAAARVPAPIRLAGAELGRNTIANKAAAEHSEFRATLASYAGRDQYF